MSGHNPDELARFWDDLAAGHDLDSDAIDPTLAEAVRRLHTAQDVDGADPAFTKRLLEELMHAPAMALPDNGIAGPLPNSNGRPIRAAWGPAVRAPARPRKRPSRAFPPFAVAALLLLALGLGYVALDPFGGGPDRPSSIPAAYAPEATPTPEPTDELLLEITLPAEALPRGEHFSSGFAHYSIPPGARGTWTPNCCTGPMVEYVLSGAYTVRAEAVIDIVRAGGVVEEVPAGTEVALGPGDALLSRVETVVEAANTGEMPVELLSWVLVEDPTNAFNGHLLPGWWENDIDVRDVRDQPPGVSVPAGSAAVRLRRVELAPDAVIPAPPSGGTSFAVILRENAAGTPTRAVLIGPQSDGTIRSLGQVAATVYVLTLEPADAGESGSPTP